MSQAGVSVSHIAICTRDVEHAARFYTEAFGFELVHWVEIAAPFDRMTEIPGSKGRAGFFRLGGVQIELATYETGVIGPAERRPMNQIGLTHLSFIVADLEAVVARIVELGGQVYPQTKVVTPMGPMIFCTDPDGTRLELWQKPPGA